MTEGPNRRLRARFRHPRILAASLHIQIGSLIPMAECFCVYGCP
jgi:hypothetical protein